MKNLTLLHLEINHSSLVPKNNFCSIFISFCQDKNLRIRLFLQHLLKESNIVNAFNGKHGTLMKVYYDTGIISGCTCKGKYLCPQLGFRTEGNYFTSALSLVGLFSNGWTKTCARTLLEHTLNRGVLRYVTFKYLGRRKFSTKGSWSKLYFRYRYRTIM